MDTQLYGLRRDRGYWLSRSRRIAFVEWLGARLGFIELDDWYQATRADFVRGGGGRLLDYYGQSPLAILIDCLPEHDWKPWLFKRVPKGFWNDLGNCHQWVEWFEREAGIEGLEDWYSVRRHTLLGCRGGSSMLRHLRSVVAIAAFQHPEYEWLEWKSAQVAPGFWDVRANRRRYLEWLGAKLGYTTEEAWLHLTQREIKENCGGGLLERYAGSPADLLRDTLLSGDTPPWTFHMVGNRFWESRENQPAYFRWLGDQLGFTQPADWSRLRRIDLVWNHGAGLLRRYPWSAGLLKELLPEVAVGWCAGCADDC